MPRHYQRHFRRSGALRFASRARRRNKRLNDQRSFAVFRRTKKRHDLRLRYDHGCHIGYDFARLSLDTLTFLVWVARGRRIWESHMGRPHQRASFYVWSPLCIGRWTRLQHSIDNVCPFFTLSRSSINQQTFWDVSYGSGLRVCTILICFWVPFVSLIARLIIFYTGCLPSDKSTQFR